MSTSRGVLYMVWGQRAARAAERSVASLRSVHPELAHEVIRLPDDTHPIRGLLEKSRMMQLTPFDETLFLDADTVVMGRLDFGFEQARRFGVACCICECPWARRYRGLPDDDGIEYNTGVLFFDRRAQALFERWHALVPTLDSSIDYVGHDGAPMVMRHNDQGAFAQAVREWDRAPFVLPLNWNFRPIWQRAFFGPIKVWHDYSDPPPGLLQINASYAEPGRIIEYHTIGKQK